MYTKKSNILILLSLFVLGCSQSVPTNTSQPSPSVSNAVSSINNNSTVNTNPVLPKILHPVSSVKGDYFYNQKNPGYSPDGSKVVFMRGSKIYVSDINGQSNILIDDLQKDYGNITLTSQVYPVWSPTGDKIAFIVRQLSGSKIHILKADGTDKYISKNFISTSYNLIWSPDGQKVMGTDEKNAPSGLYDINIFIIDTTLKSLSYLLDEKGNKISFSDPIDIYLSPDGKKLVIHRFLSTLLSLYDFHTAQTKVIKEVSATDSSQFINWSPDSKSIIFQKMSKDGTTSSVVKLEIDTGKETRISLDNEYANSPVWSYDGKRIAYSTIQPNSMSKEITVKTVNSDGSGSQSYKLQSNSMYIYNLRWTPDNTALLAADDRNLYFIDLKDGTLKTFESLSVQFSPDSKTLFYMDRYGEAVTSDINGDNKTNLFIRPVNPLVSKFNLKTPSNSEITELKNSKIVDANSKFALKILNKLSNDKPKENIFISPFSMSIDIAMAMNGAENNTKSQIMNTLEYSNSDINSVNKYNNLILKSLLTNQDIQLSIANALFVEQNVSFKQNFLDVNKNSYFSDVQKINMSSPDSLNIINDWVNDNTNNKIPHIIDNIDPSDVIYLINAVYFKGTWTNVFETSLTKNHDFKMADGNIKSVPMMNQSGSYIHFKDNNVEFIRLPYGNSQRMAMYIFLPNENTTLEQFKNNLNFDNFKNWLSSANNERGIITIPKYKLDYDADLVNPLITLGMSDAFDAQKADFSNMSDRGLYLTKAKHKTFVEVNEEGTEAAAATIIGGSVTSAPPPPFKFVADRPFMMAIVDDTTKTLLFTGLIYEPKQ